MCWGCLLKFTLSKQSKAFLCGSIQNIPVLSLLLWRRIKGELLPNGELGNRMQRNVDLIYSLMRGSGTFSYFSCACYATSFIVVWICFPSTEFPTSSSALMNIPDIVVVMIIIKIAIILWATHECTLRLLTRSSHPLPVILFIASNSEYL